MTIRSPALLCSRCTLYTHHLMRPQFAPRYVSFSIQKQCSRSFKSQHALYQQQLHPATPPNPLDLPKPKAASKSRKWLRRLIYLSAGTATLVFVDQYFYASSVTRSLRTFGTGLYVALDYKINFRAHPFSYDNVEELHAASAERLFNLLHTNGGLYLKIGQAIAMQSAVLPPQFQKMFSRMFDDAPQNSWADVEKVIREDFGGRSPEELFGLIEHTARASASVAQVHWARLPDGREVAVKIQKREIAQQVGWDLWAFKTVARIYSWWFDIPMYTLVPFVMERLMLETDFENEAANSEKMKELVQGERRLRNRVYIPPVDYKLSSKRVMTAEWIEGVRLWDKEGVSKPWYGGWRTGSPGCGGTPLDKPGTYLHVDQKNIDYGKVKPDRSWWKGRTGTGGLGLSMKEVMTTMVDLFSAQMFLWGFVHCDPHPGNIFVRRQPDGHAQLVLIDHGLYIRMDPKFRHEYARFWKGLLALDNKEITNVVSGWGIQAPDIFASATLMRPYTGGDRKMERDFEELSKMDEATRRFEAQKRMRQGVRDILGDGSQFPKELIFIGRNLRIVQGNNQFLGSPVNRLKITGQWASRALVDSPDLPLSTRFVNFGRHIIFNVVLISSDIVFYFSKARQLLGLGGGMESDIEESMRSMAKGMGVELNHGVFEG